jgi:hypothetical protein
MIGKITPAPNVNRVAPNQRASRWADVARFLKPFDNPKPNEFGFWFNYFWGEAASRTELTETQKAKAAEIFLEVFNVAGNVATPVAGLGTFSDQKKENILRQLLLLGFRRVALTPPRMTSRAPVNGRQLAPPPLMAVDAAALNLDYVIQATDDSASHRGAIPIAFRCDGRAYRDLELSGGMKARARSKGEKVFNDYAMNQPWNPLSNPVYGNSLWLRMGSRNKDNCLQTVISVGPRFSAIAHFPILNDFVLVFQAKSADGQFLALKRDDEWTQDDIAAAAAHWLKVRAIPDPSGGVQRLEKDNQVYIFHLRGLRGINTSAQFAGKDEFPERGMESVPLNNILAVVEFVQLWWFNPDNRQFMLYKLVFQPILWLPTEQAVELQIGHAGRIQLEGIIQTEINLAKARFANEEVAYDQFQPIKPTLLKAAERRNIIEAIREFRAGALRKDYVQTKERNAAKLRYPALALKIDKISVLEWKEYYQRRAEIP